MSLFKYSIQGRKQSFGFLLNKIEDMLDEGAKVFGITLSNKMNATIQNNVVSALAEHISVSKKVAVVDFDFISDTQKDRINIVKIRDSYNKINILVQSREFMREKLDSLRNEYDVVFLRLPVAYRFAMVLECAKLCDKIFSVEKYRYTKYLDFEHVLDILDGAGLKLDGVIPCK